MSKDFELPSMAEVQGIDLGLWENFSHMQYEKPWTLLSPQNVLDLAQVGLRPAYVKRFWLIGRSKANQNSGDLLVEDVLTAHREGFTEDVMLGIRDSLIQCGWEDYIPALRAGLYTRGQVGFLAATEPDLGSWEILLLVSKSRQPHTYRFLEDMQSSSLWFEMLDHASDSYRLGRALGRNDVFLAEAIESLLGGGAPSSLHVHHFIKRMMYFYFEQYGEEEMSRITEIRRKFVSEVGDFG